MVLAFGIPLVLMAPRPATTPDPMLAAATHARAIAAVLAATADRAAVARAVAASDGADRISVHGLTGGLVGPRHADDDAIAAFTDGPGTTTVPGGMSYVDPVDLGRGRVGAVEIFVPQAGLPVAAPPADHRVWWLVLVAGVVAALGTILATDRLARRVTRTATAIADAALALGDGDEPVRVPLRGSREVAGAARAFNAMSDRVAEQRAAERELIADLSHRLRTPLTALRLEAERVRGGSTWDTRLSQAVEAMEREVDHLIHAARRQSPTPAAEPENCDASEVVRERMAFWSAVAEDQSRPFSVVGTTRRSPVGLARTELAAALDALLGNVFRYTPQGTPFEVAVTRRDGFVAVRVDDAGPGIAHPGRALRRGASDRGSTGLGLDIVRRAALAGHGAVDVDRAALGGASVVMLLADAEPPAQPVRQRLGFVGRLSREPDERRWGRQARAARSIPTTDSLP